MLFLDRYPSLDHHLGRWSSAALKYTCTTQTSNLSMSDVGMLLVSRARSSFLTLVVWYVKERVEHYVPMKGLHKDWLRNRRQQSYDRSTLQSVASRF
jgi:hypothetical protein